MTTTLIEAPEVLVPTSREEAISTFGDGADVTVFAGGTVLMPDIAMGRLRPRRALLLSRAGLDAVHREDGRLRIGATATLTTLEDDAPEPLRSAAHGVADPEIRAQATVGGNLCAPPALASPRGDLQAALIAHDAKVRSVGAGGERLDSVEDFLARADRRLVLEIELEEPRRGSYVALGRPHAHSFTILTVACAETANGVRVAVGGAGPRAMRAPSVEQALTGGADVATAAQNVSRDIQPHDDALASAWYRTRILPSLVERALTQL